MKTLDLPKNGRLPSITKFIESAMKGGKGPDLRRACTGLLGAASDFYRVPNCAIRVNVAHAGRRHRGRGQAHSGGHGGADGQVENRARRNPTVTVFGVECDNLPLLA
jgi:hypothetical protein